MINEALYSSRSTDWATPDSLYDNLNREFRFDLDAAANMTNAKCVRYFTAADDALTKSWDGRVWCNPPYGRDIEKWVSKAQNEVHTNPMCDFVVMLLFARTDTRWFHEYLYHQSNVELRFLRGRIRFGNAKNPAPFPSMIAIIRRE